MAFFLGHCYHYYPFIADDALISLRYADRLVHGHGLTWDTGNTVEGYTNFLWTMLLAGAGWIAGDMIIGLRILSLVFAVATLLISFHWMRNKGLSVLESSWAAGLLVGSSTFVVWSIAGMEAILNAFLLTLLVARLDSLGQTDSAIRLRPVLGVTLILSLLCLSRPDSVLFVGAAVFALVLTMGLRRAGVPAAIVIIGTLLTICAHTGFRLVYYGDWVPNTAYVKARVTSTTLKTGLLYLIGAGMYHGVIILAGSLGMWRWAKDRKDRLLAYFSASAVLGWSAYVLAIGGDHFPAYRHLMPILILSGLSAPFCLSFPRVRVRIQGAHAWAMAFATIALVSGVWMSRDPSLHVLKDSWTWSCMHLAEDFRGAFANRSPVLATHAAGCFPFVSQFETIDMLGLNDKHIARQPSLVAEAKLVAHNVGDPVYVYGQRPDLVITSFSGDMDPFPFPEGLWPATKNLVNMPEFRGNYQYFIVDIAARSSASFWHPRPRVLNGVWVRKSGKLGVEYRPNEVVVPSYLLASKPDCHYYCSGEPNCPDTDMMTTCRDTLTNLRSGYVQFTSGQFFVPMDSGASLALPPLSLTAGLWHPSCREIQGGKQDCAFYLLTANGSHADVSQELRITSPQDALLYVSSPRRLKLSAVKLEKSI